MKNNPFTLIFGVKPSLSIERTIQFNQITETFLSEKPVTTAYMITGVRGSGKTVLLAETIKYFKNLDDWVVIELNPERDMVELFAASLYNQSNAKFKFAKKEFSFSFHGISFSIEGDRPVSDASSLIEEMLLYLEKKGKKIFIAIDEVSNTPQMKVFAQEYQMWIRSDFHVYLLMTGLYENIRSLQNESTLTFLYRLPVVQLDSLSMIEISNSFEKVLNVDKSFSNQLAKLTNGYAYAYQVLGYLCYEHEYKSLNNELLNEYDKYLRTYVYDKIWLDLPKKEKEIVVALSQLKERTTKSILEKLKMNKFNFSVYRDRLIKKGIIYSPNWGQLEFVLPRFNKFIMDMYYFESEDPNL